LRYRLLGLITRFGYYLIIEVGENQEDFWFVCCDLVGK